MSKPEEFTDAFAALQISISDMIFAYDALEKIEEIKAPLIDAITEATEDVGVRYSSMFIMMTYLEQFVGNMLGQAGKRLTTSEERLSFVDGILDHEHPKLFALMRQMTPDEPDAETERLMAASCNRVRNYALHALE